MSISKTIVKYSVLLFMSCLPSVAFSAESQQVSDENQSPQSQYELSLEQAVSIATEDNPGIAEIKARADAMAAIPSQVSTLDDPVVGLNFLNFPVDTLNFGQEAMTQLQFGVSQKIPFPGKLELRGKIADYEAEATRNNIDEIRLLISRDVKSRWWNLFYLDKSLQILTTNQELLRQFVQIAQTKYKVAQGLQQDVLLAQLELSKLLEKEIEINRVKRTEVARINTLMNRSTETPIEISHKARIELPEILPESQLFELARISRPVLASQQSLIKAAQTRYELAKKDRLPDFNIGAYYGIRGSSDSVSSRTDLMTIRLSMNIPLFADRKQYKKIDQRNSELMSSEYKLQDDKGRVELQITSAVIDYQQARDQVSLFESGIIPLAQQTVASMLAGYQVNKVDFLNLVRAQITSYDYETRYWRALSEANSALAKLVAAVGEETIYE